MRRPRLPDGLLRALRRVGLPATEIGRYWTTEYRSLRASAGALAVGLVATLVAGVVLGSAREPLATHSGLLVLIPAAIGMRGSLFGALAARLSTGILTGEFEPALVRRSFLGRQLEASLTLTATSSVQAGVLAWGVARLLGQGPIGVLDLIAVSLLGGLLSSSVLFVVTVQLARRAQRAGWSMDDVGAPTITATGDLVSLPALLLASTALSVPVLTTAVGSIAVVGAIVAAVTGVRRQDPTIRRVVRESLVVLTVSVTIDVLAGAVMEARLDEFLVVPTVLVLIPPFIACCGSLGGMLASRLASKLHVGLIDPTPWPGRAAGLDISTTFLLSLGSFAGVGAVGWAAARLAGLSPPAMSTLVLTALVAGLLATVLLAAVAYAAATATFRFGLDPDNHGIPIVTASMDLLGVLCLVAILPITGVA